MDRQKNLFPLNEITHSQVLVLVIYTVMTYSLFWLDENLMTFISNKQLC
jgi:hypothetical protein